MSDELVLESRDCTELSANHMGSGCPLVLMHGSIVTQETWALDAGDRDAFLGLLLTEMAGGTDEEVAVLRSIPEVWARLLDGARSEIVAREADELVARGWKPERYRAVAAPTLLLVGALTHSRCMPPSTTSTRPSPTPRLRCSMASATLRRPSTRPGSPRAMLAFTATHG
jgi:hypothetical protein